MNAQKFRLPEIRHIVGDDKTGVCRKSEFQNEVIIRVRKERSPSIKDFLMGGESTQAIDEFADFDRLQRRYQTGSQSHILVFQGKCRR